MLVKFQESEFKILWRHSQGSTVEYVFSSICVLETLYFYVDSDILFRILFIHPREDPIKSIKGLTISSALIYICRFSLLYVRAESNLFILKENGRKLYSIFFSSRNHINVLCGLYFPGKWNHPHQI